MALVPCAVCRQPFYASCHDASCVDAVCPLCEYAEVMDDESVSGALPVTEPVEPAPSVRGQVPSPTTS
jgi:hypothetical protein